PDVASSLERIFTSHGSSPVFLDQPGSLSLNARNPLWPFPFRVLKGASSEVDPERVSGCCWCLRATRSLCRRRHLVRSSSYQRWVAVPLSPWPILCVSSFS